MSSNQKARTHPLFNFGGTDFDGTGLGSSSKILPSEGCSISRDVPGEAWQLLRVFRNALVHLLERRSKREGDGVRCCSVEWETLSWTSINICFTESNTPPSKILSMHKVLLLTLERFHCRIVLSRSSSVFVKEMLEMLKLSAMPCKGTNVGRRYHTLIISVATLSSKENPHFY